MTECWSLARHQFKDNSHLARLKQQGGLQNDIELAVGSKIIITTNLDTDMDIMNGVQGQIIQICVVPHDEIHSSDCMQEMKYPASCILVKLERYGGQEIDELGEGTIPLYPIQQSFEILMPSGDKKVIHRRQLMMDGAYAFTDY